MKVLRVVIALVITLGMLYIARTNSRGHPEQLSHTDGTFRFEMTTVPKIIEYEADTVRVRVEGPDSLSYHVLFRTSQPVDAPADQLDRFASVPMIPEGENDEYYLVARAGKKGGRFHYYFQVVDTAGSELASFQADKGEAFFLRYIGEVPPIILILHIIFIFATVFCVAMSTVQAFRLLLGQGDLHTMMRCLLMATVFCFIGGYPFGIPMNYYAFTGDWLLSWEGVPFGTDATDNKTQLMFVYLLFATLSGLGSLTRGRFGRDVFRRTGLIVVGLGSFAVMLFIYLIPHSIQFSPALTYTFCYSWIGVLALVYVVARLRHRPCGQGA